MAKQILKVINNCMECDQCILVHIPSINITSVPVCIHDNVILSQGIETVKRIIPYTTDILPKNIPNWCPLDEYSE